jgi:hypothetical protein
MVERKAGYGKKRETRKPTYELGFAWGRTNWALLLAGVVSLALGFAALARGSMTLAPVLLVVGYLVLVPASLLIRPKTRPTGE